MSRDATPVPAADSARAIAKQAYIYGFPNVDSYRILHADFVDKGGPQYKTNWNILFNTAREDTPAVTAVQTPNADTPCLVERISARSHWCSRPADQRGPLLLPAMH